MSKREEVKNLLEQLFSSKTFSTITDEDKIIINKIVNGIMDSVKEELYSEENSPFLEAYQGI